jgi:Flp pilus assembly protein TadD
MLLMTLYPWHLLRYAPIWRDNLVLFERMERAAPRSPNPSLNLGLTYYRLDDFPRAAAAVERAVRTNPSQRRPREILGLLYVLQGRAAEGFRLLDAVAAEGPPDRDYYVARTTAHLTVREWHQALAVAAEGAARFPKDADLQEGQGRALERLGRTGEAMERYRQALASRPEAFQVEEALGHLLARSGRPAEAARHFLRSAEIRPDRPQPIRALALLLEARGDRSGSLQLWRQVLELAESGPTLREAAGHIRRLERDGAGPGARPDGGRRS